MYIREMKQFNVDEDYLYRLSIQVIDTEGDVRT